MREIPFGRPLIGKEEICAVTEVLKGPILVHGPKAKEFEEHFAAYTNSPNAASVSSCTAALHLTYFDLALKSGDEVIVPAQTHNATAHAVEFVGAKPIFVDAEIETGNINIDLIENYITEKTKAISIVHYLGMPVDMDRINNIAKKYKLYVIEDCALSLGAYYKGIHTGLLGDAGCFSFYPVKHMTTAEGGMFISKNSDAAARITKKKAFGVNRNHTERSVPGVYDVDMLGFNYRMNEIQAVIGIEQLKKMHTFLEKRKSNYETLNKGLSEINELKLFKSSYDKFQSSYYCLSIILDSSIKDKRFELVMALKEKGIGTSVYYPRPVPHFSYYKNKYGFKENSFPIASEISYNSIALPVGPHLNNEDMKYMVKSIKESILKIKSL